MTYERWIKKVTPRNRAIKHVLKHDIEPLDEHTCLMWIGDRKTAKKIVFFIHGGGYVFPILDGHLEWCASYVRATIGTRSEIAVAVLQYTLYPAAIYPTQLQQAAAGLQHLLNSGHKASDIIIGGDSAGGQLSSSLLWHLVRPHPLVEQIEGRDGPLGGCFLVSPWIASMDRSEAFRENAHVDLLSAGILENTEAFMIKKSIAKSEIADGKGWSLPGDVNASWFDDLYSAASNLYITAGKQELFRDQCIAFARSVEQRNGKKIQVILEVPELEAHDFIILEGAMGIQGDATMRMLRWIKSIID